VLNIKKLPDGGLHISIQPPIQPRVYLDYGAIGKLAASSELGERFKRTLLNSGGTLCLSSASLLELYGLGLGPTHEKIKSFLASFGRSFLLFDCDSGEVIKREAIWVPGEQNSSLDVKLLTAVVANWDGITELSFAVLLNTIDQDATVVEQFKDLHRRHRDDLYKLFAKARKEYQSNSEVKNRLDKAIYQREEGTPPTEYFANQLRRQTIVTHEPLTQSDGIDFEHAVVSLGYAEHVVLDKKWVARVKRFPPLSHAAKVWKIGELSRLIAELEQNEKPL
jgi:hypothetical protein